MVLYHQKNILIRYHTPPIFLPTISNRLICFLFSLRPLLFFATLAVKSFMPFNISCFIFVFSVILLGELCGESFSLFIALLRSVFIDFVVKNLFSYHPSSLLRAYFEPSSRLHRQPIENQSRINRESIENRISPKTSAP